MATDFSVQASLGEPCEICSAIDARETARQKWGWEEQDTHLPPAAARLHTVLDLSPEGSRALLLQQCPICQTWYLYASDYEYLANGSEDEQTLTRLTFEQVLALIRDPR